MNAGVTKPDMWLKQDNINSKQREKTSTKYLSNSFERAHDFVVVLASAPG